MPKLLSIFILFTFIWQFLFASYVPLKEALLDNSNEILQVTQQPHFIYPEQQNLLIYPSNFLYKKYISSFTNSKSITKIFRHVKTFDTDLQFEENFLSTFSHYIRTEIQVLNLKGSETFLYHFDKSFERSILFAQNTLFLVEKISFKSFLIHTEKIARLKDSIFIYFSDQILRPLVSTYLENGVQIMVANDWGVYTEKFEFFLTDENTKVLAFGEFYGGVPPFELFDAIWESQNLNFYKRIILKILYFIQVHVALLYPKYLIFIDDVLQLPVNFLQTLMTILIRNPNYINFIFFGILWIFTKVFHLIFLKMILHPHLILLPFRVCTLPISIYTNQCLPYATGIIGCFFSLIFPQTTDIFAPSLVCHGEDSLRIRVSRLIKNYELEPQKNTDNWAIPILVRGHWKILWVVWAVWILFTPFFSWIYTILCWQCVGEPHLNRTALGDIFL